MNRSLRSPVLVVDDDQIDREMAERALSAEYEVVQARDGNEALALVGQRHFACVLLDLNLPGQHGQSLIEPMSKHAPVIVLTGQGDESQAVSAMKGGAVDYLIKDRVDREALRRAVSSAIERRRLQQTVEEQRRRLLEEERIKVLMQLAGSSLVDLNEPITRLSLLLERLIQDEDKPPRMEKTLDESSRAMSEVTTVMRRIQQLRLQEVELHHPGETAPDVAPQNLSVLVVEDDPTSLMLLVKSLEADRAETNITTVKSVSCVREAAAQLEERSFDLILTDFKLPDGTARDILSHAARKPIAIPVIVVSATGNDELVADLLRSGVSDYVSQAALGGDSLRKALRRTLERSALASALRQSRERLHSLAFTDELTQLYNRRFLEESLTRELNRIARHRGSAALCLIDIDHFKRINDTYGHAAGDTALRCAAETIRGSIRKTDLAARYGGEEFVVLLPNTEQDAALAVAEDMRSEMEAIDVVHEREVIKISASFGVAFMNGADQRSVSEIIAAADTALYRAKSGGRNRVVGEE